MSGVIPPLLQYAFIVLYSVKAQGQLYLLEKLIVTELVKKFPAFYDTCGFITVFTTVRHWSLSWAR
jgi:hypothetical protein